MKIYSKFLLTFLIFAFLINSLLVSDENNEFSSGNEDIVFEKGVIHLYWYYPAVLEKSIVSIDNPPEEQRDFDDEKMKILKEKHIETQFENVKGTSEGKDKDIIELEIDIEGFETALLQYDGRLIHLMLVMENPIFSEIEYLIDDRQELVDYVWSITNQKSEISAILRELTEALNEEFGESIFGCYIWGTNEGVYSNYFKEYKYTIRRSSLMDLWNVTLYCPNFEKDKLEEYLQLKILPKNVGESEVYYCWKDRCKISLITRNFQNLGDDRAHAFNFNDLSSLIYHQEIRRIVISHTIKTEIYAILNDEIELSEEYITFTFDDMDDVRIFDNYYCERYNKIRSLKKFIEKSKEMVSHYVYDLKWGIMPHEKFQEFYPETYAHLEGIQKNMTGSTINDLDNIEQLVLELEGNLKEAKDMRDIAYSTLEETNWRDLWIIIPILIPIITLIYKIFVRKKESQRARNEKMAREIIEPLIKETRENIKYLEKKDYGWRYRHIRGIHKLALCPLDVKEELLYDDFKKKQSRIYSNIEKHDEEIDRLEKKLNNFAEEILLLSDFKEEVSKMFEKYPAETHRKGYFRPTDENFEIILRFIINNRKKLGESNIYNDFWDKNRIELIKILENKKFKEYTKEIEILRIEALHLSKKIDKDLKNTLKKYGF